MKSSTKSRLISALVALAMLVSCGIFAVTLGASHKTEAATPKNEALTYYYSELGNSPLARKFYDIMSEMDKEGYFISGRRDYDLTSALSQADLDEYAKGDSKIPVALGAARDAFFMDHPDLFYADVHKLALRVGMSDNKYVAYLGLGRSENYYNDYTVTNEDETRAAIVKYNDAINGIVAKVNNSMSVVEKIRFVNQTIAEELTYSFGAYEDEHKGVRYNGFVHTSYAIVEKEALCDGYASAFKAVLDRLDIPCVLIVGSAFSPQQVLDENGKTVETGYESHMWNAVKVDGHWYCVDVTWNDTENHLDKYTLVGGDFISGTHREEHVISSTGFKLKYPALRALGYGVNSDKNGFTFKDSGKIGDTEFGYNTDSEGRHSLELGVSYDGKNITQLLAEGKYFAQRTKENDTGWTDWVSIPATVESMTAMGWSDKEVREYWDSMCREQYTVVSLRYTSEAVEFAIVGAHNAEGFYYTAAEMEKYAIAYSITCNNDGYMQNIPAPYVKSISEAHISIEDFKPQKVVMAYDEQLVKPEGAEKAEIGITVTSAHEDINNYVEVKDVKFDPTANTVTFMFTPSRMYAHNGEVYYFVPTNLVGKNSGKVPSAGRYQVRLEPVVCPKVFKDGRLFMKVMGEPEFVSASDQSMNEFKDKNGKPIVGDQRSQLMLVVNKPNDTESAEMESAAIEQTDLEKSDIYASATYQISLQICGMIQKVPTGSFMQVGFGFPEGYGPEDEGVTFTVYHYTRTSTGEIDEVQEVPCVITPYGIIATVKSFSPFMICAVNADKVNAAKKAVLATVNGVGGTVDKLDIQTIENGNITYTLTADGGYRLHRVMLNGKTDITDKVSNGKLTLAYADLASSNSITVEYIADSVVAADAKNNVVMVDMPEIVVTDSDMIVATDPVSISVEPNGGNGANVGLIVGIVIAVVVVLAGAGVAVYFLVFRKKKQAVPAGAETAATAAQKPQTDNRQTAQPAKQAQQQNKTQPAQPARPQAPQANRAQTAQPTRPQAQQPNRTQTTQSARPQTTATRPTAQRTTPTNSARPTARPNATSNRPTSSGSGQRNAPPRKK